MELYTYEYVPKNVELTLDKNYAFQDGIVIYLNIVHDYMNRRLPVIQMGLDLTSEHIKLIYDYKNTAKIKFDLYEYQKNSNNEIINISLYFRKTFTIVPAKNKTSYITAMDIETNNNIDVMKRLQQFDMYLIDMNMVNIFNMQINGIFKNASCPEVLQALFTLRNIDRGIVIATPPMQTNKLDQVMIPLGDLIDNIDKLNVGYGLYDSYTIVYHDLFNLYCLNKITPNVILPYTTDYGTITFILKNITDPSHSVLGSYNDPITKTHYINLQKEPSIKDNTIQDSSSKFSTLATIDSSGKVTKTTIDDDVSSLSYTYAYNALTSQQIMHEVMSGPTITISTSNCGMSFIKPYKIYNFNIDSQYTNLNVIGKVYKLQNYNINIYRTGKSDYLHDLSITVYSPDR